MHRFITELNHFGPLFVKKKTSAKFFPKNQLSQLSLYATATSYKKNRKVSCIDFPKKLEKLHFGSISAPFVSKKSFAFNFEHLYCYNPMQKIRKVSCTDF